jgi:hypothetical protein
LALHTEFATGSGYQACTQNSGSQRFDPIWLPFCYGSRKKTLLCTCRAWVCPRWASLLQCRCPGWRRWWGWRMLPGCSAWLRWVLLPA